MSEAFSKRNLVNSTRPSWQRFVLQLGRDGPEAWHVCAVCDARFEQSDEGVRNLKAHEFEHGAATRFPLEDLDGMHGTIFVVRIERNQNWGPTLELFFRANDGTVYGLPTPEHYSWEEKASDYKWKTWPIESARQISSPVTVSVQA